jgi:hypothetical protein
MAPPIWADGAVGIMRTTATKAPIIESLPSMINSVCKVLVEMRGSLNELRA